MTVKDLEILYDYGHWANRKLFDVISQLPPEQFIEGVAGSNASIRDTLVHVVSVEAGWLDRCGGPKRGPRLNPADFPTVESLTQARNRVEAHVREFLGNLTDEDLARNVEYVNDRAEKRSLPLGELMQHGANHGVQLRGQVALLLRLLGHTPGDFDILFYHADKRGIPAW
jgi:uncharacterized damage-inducible protein DinB